MKHKITVINWLLYFFKIIFKTKATMSDKITSKIEIEARELKNSIKEEIATYNELGNLEKKLGEETFALKETTQEHRSVARDTKHRLWIKSAFYSIIIIIPLIILILVLYRTLFK